MAAVRLCFYYNYFYHVLVQHYIIIKFCIHCTTLYFVYFPSVAAVHVPALSPGKRQQ